MLLNCGVGKTLESPLDCQEIQQVHPKGDQSWVFIGRTDAKAETPILWPFDVKSWLIWKDPDARKYWEQEEKGTTEDKMVGWHHWLNGHEFEQAPGDGEEKGGLVCCSPWDCKELDMTQPLKNNCRWQAFLWFHYEALLRLLHSILWGYSWYFGFLFLINEAVYLKSKIL